MNLFNTYHSKKVVGFATAQSAGRVGLLGSPPDPVGARRLHGTRPQNISGLFITPFRPKPAQRVQYNGLM